MTESNNTKAKYNFDTNLLKLSKSDVLEEAKREWREICTEKRDKKTGLCICQHTLMNIIYMYNIYTKHTIMVGTGCCKKFNLQRKSVKNNILKDVLYSIISQGEYKLIDNILQYTADIKEELVKHISKEYEDNSVNLEYLKSIYNDIEDLIHAYDLQSLQPICEEIIQRIETEKQIIIEKRIIARENKRKELEKKRMEEEAERKQKEKEQIEKENKRLQEEKERIEEEMEFKRKEKESKKECGCGLMKKNICKCEHPTYVLMTISNNLYCNNKNCGKWKCRCGK